MGTGLSAEGIADLAPDAKVAAAGKKLGVPKSWESPDRSDSALWAARNDIVTARGTS